jgi:outer membrane receptor protein involved in Fe transport
MPACTPTARRSLITLGAALCLLRGGLHAQAATGKVEGRVQDEAGAPIVQAQVYLVGTAFSAVTDSHGHYFINNIPAGTWDIRAIFLGYQPLEARGDRILADQTITQDFTLARATVTLQEIVVVTAENPLVPRDEVTTKQRIDGQVADALPVDRLSEVLFLQPGVLDVTPNALSGGGNTWHGLSIRGGRQTENATYVDGVPVQSGYKGSRQAGWLDFGSTGTSVEIGTNAIAEASVTTGSASAAFGNAKSGIISIVTKTGGSRYQGALSYETDEPFGVDHGVGLNRIEASLGGPLAGRLTFAVSGTLEGHKAVEEGFGSQDTPLFMQAGVDTTIRQASTLEDDPTTARDERLADTTITPVYNYPISRGRCDAFANAGAAGLQANRDAVAITRIRNNYGLACGGVRLPATARTLHSVTGKLNYSYGTGSRISLSVATSRFHGHQFDFIIRHLNHLSLPQNLRGFSNRSRLATLNWVQNLSKSADRALALDLALSYQQDRTISGPLTIASDLATRAPFGGFILEPMRFLYDFDNFPIDDRLIENVRRFEGRMTPHDRLNDSYSIVDNLRNDAYGLYGSYPGFTNTLGGDVWQFGESGGVSGGQVLNLYQEDRYIAKAALDWQADRFDRIKLGGELTRYAIDYYASFLRGVPDTYIERPVRWNAFVEDRLDLGDVVVVGGLRYDWYDSRASRPYASDTAGHRYQFPRVSSTLGFDPSDPTAQFVRDRSHHYLSPRVQVSFPVSDRTNFRLSYSHQVQVPDFELVLSGINLDYTLGNQVFGTDLDFGKTIAFEFGIRHAFSDDMVLDVAAYNKSVISDPAARLVTRYDPALRHDTELAMMTNLDFGNVRGVDVRLDRRLGNFFNGTIGYSYQWAENTGSDPFTYINYGSRIVNQVGGINGAQPPPQAILPTSDSRPHALTGAFSITFPPDWKSGSVLGAVLGGVGVFSTLRYMSGSAYTRCGESTQNQSVLSVENCIRLFPEGLNSRRLPPFKAFDARFTKRFGLRGLDVTGYLDIRNLFNFKNVLQVFAVNGSVRNDVEREANLRADLGDLASEGSLNGALGADSAIVLDFPHESCALWISSRQRPAAANCMYLIRAEQRFGNGDGVFTVAEQTRAINALYDVVRGGQQQTPPGRRARLGVEVDF